LVKARRALLFSACAAVARDQQALTPERPVQILDPSTQAEPPQPMPILIVKTNADLSSVDRPGLLRTASETVAAMLGKPEGYVMVILEPTPDMCFGGDSAPLAYLELKSLGLPEDRTPEFSAALCALLQQQLGIAPGRVYIEFASPARHLFGFDGKTF
jgi:phenylpyruvate tautomerase